MTKKEETPTLKIVYNKTNFLSAVTTAFVYSCESLQTAQCNTKH